MSVAHAPPIAIGGLGGSGTRVFAAALQHLGVAIGERLNPALDNLWFTVLFKRHDWVYRRPERTELAQAIDLLVRAMTTGLSERLSSDERELFHRLGLVLPPEGHWRCGAKLTDLESLVASSTIMFGPWGWKEPNTHLFIREIDSFIEGFRYVHVVRDPVDMAFSKNKWQMRHWSHLFGLPFVDDEAAPVRQLRYWNRANQAAIDYGVSSMSGRFLVIPYEDFCAQPAKFMEVLRTFVGFDGELSWPDDMVQPTTIGRSKNYDLSILPAAELEQARFLLDRIGQFNSNLF